jgi:hypothetical protein
LKTLKAWLWVLWVASIFVEQVYTNITEEKNS